MEVKAATELFLVGAIGTPSAGQIPSVLCAGAAEAFTGPMG